MNGNPFYVDPLGGKTQGILKGLSGLGATLKEKREMEGAQARQQQMQADFQNLQGSQNYEDYANFSIQYPEFAAQAKDAFGFTNKQSEKAATDTYIDVLTAQNEEQALQALESGMDKVTEMGGTPTNMAQDYDALLMGEKGALESIRQGALLAKPELLKSWKSIREMGGKDGLPDVKSVKDINTDISKMIQEPTSINNAYTSLSSLQQDASPTDQLAAVFKFMKALDPTSSVRESEQGQVYDAQGAAKGIAAKLNHLIGGGGITEDNFKDIVGTAYKLSKSASDSASTEIVGYLDTYGDKISPEQKDKFRARLQRVDPIAAPPKAVEMLRSNPALRDAFLEKYGYLPEGIK